MNPAALTTAAQALALATLTPATAPPHTTATTPDRPAPLSCAVTRIVDGDTLRLDSEGTRISVRLKCIDAPELDQPPWGKMATAYLRAHLPARVQFHPETQDIYRRQVGVIADEIDGQDLGLALVTAALVPIDPRYCHDRNYLAAETEARTAAIGIWNVGGDHQRPWVHRADRKKAALPGIPPR